MSRSPHTFKQRDLTRAIKGAQAAGVDVRGVIVDKNGQIVVLFGKPAETADRETNEWDSV
jgi:hypothetical protein